MSDWVNINDSMPSEGTEILLYGTESDFSEMTIYLGDYMDGFFAYMTPCNRFEGRLNKVTHWMPLPNPPKD